MTDTSTEAAKLAAECRARAEAATPGPWESITEVSNGVRGCRWIRSDDKSDTHVATLPGAVSLKLDNKANADFIAQARSDVPALCDAIDKQAEEIKRLRAIEERAKAAVEELSGSKYLPSPQTYVARVRHILVGHGYE